MDSIFQSFFLNQFVKGGTVLLHAVFLGVIMIAVIYRPRHVRSRELVIAAIVFFAAALVVPNVLLQSTLAKETNNSGSRNESSLSATSAAKNTLNHRPANNPVID